MHMGSSRMSVVTAAANTAKIPIDAHSRRRSCNGTMLPFVYNAEEDTRGNGAVQESEVGYYDSYRQNQQRGYEQKDHNQSDYYRDQDYRDSAAEREPRNTRDDYDRGRGRHKSRSRSRSWSRGRHERNRDRRSRSRDRYRRDRSRSRSKSPRNSRRRRSRSRDADRDRARGRDFEKASAFPVNKLVITSMPSNIDKNMITLALASSGYLPQDIRIMNKFDKAAGCARSFGFIDFSDVSTATRWMDDNKGILELSDGRRLRVEYAKGDLGFSGRRADNDWICAHCAMNNFFKRENCFKCDIPKESSMLLERQGVHMSGINPCDTLLLRNLPDGCETSTIFENLANYISLSSISMVQISESRSYAYVQMKSTAEAELLLNNSYKTPIQIAGKDILTNYCIHPMSKIIQNQMTILNAGTPTALGAAPASQVSGAEVAHAAMMKAAALRHASSQVGKMLSRNAPPPQISQQPLAAPVVTDFSVPPPTMINTSVPPPSMASMSAQTKNGIIGITPTPRGVFPKYVTPNPMMFVVDNASGYYLDRVTNFFYDVTTTYYYNNEARQWCYFDATYQTYFPVENNPAADASIAVVDPSAQVGKQVEEEISKDPKSKTAADLAKDMLKWAKKQEKIKVQMSIKPLVKQLETKSAFHSANSSSGKSERQTISPSDDDDEEDERRSQEKELVKVREPKETPSTTRNVNEEREAMERALIDESKKMCLLCKRAFPSLDVLRKHIDKSDLHQKNLEEKRAEWNRQNVEPVAERSDDFPGFSGAEFSMPKMVYRDRAKERREQFGSDPSGLVQEHKKVAVVRSEESIRRESEEAAQRPLDDKNIGNKLLKSMGWKEGQGVGRNGQGIVAPIQAERFVAGAGLGSAGARQTGGVEATHREKTRAALFSRYHQT